MSFLNISKATVTTPIGGKERVHGPISDSEVQASTSLDDRFWAGPKAAEELQDWAGPSNRRQKPATVASIRRHNPASELRSNAARELSKEAAEELRDGAVPNPASELRAKAARVLRNEAI